jgi:hypothetical protein
MHFEQCLEACFLVTVEILGECIGDALGMSLKRIGNEFEMHWKCSGNTLGSLWDRVENSWGMLWESIGSREDPFEYVFCILLLYITKFYHYTISYIIQI